MGKLIGQTLGKYEIRDKIGEGGMAAVYRGYQVQLDRFVAVKVLSAILAKDESFLERFRQEAVAIGKLEHPHILPVYDFGETADGLPYMVMRYVGGGTLRDQMLKGISMEESVKIIRDIASALGYAHSVGVIHRDVKPTNVLMDANSGALLADFGLVKLLEGSKELTATGVVGTPQYMSPEQAMGETLDGRTDIYSLGVMLYEMVVGRPPFVGDSSMAVLMQTVSDPVPPPRDVNPNVPPAIQSVILKALMKNPGQRYRTCEDFIKALDGAMRSLDAEDTQSFTQEQPPTYTPPPRVAPASSSTPGPHKIQPIQPVSPPVSRPVSPPPSTSRTVSTPPPHDSTLQTGGYAAQKRRGSILPFLIPIIIGGGGILAVALVGIILFVLWNGGGISFGPTPTPTPVQVIPTPAQPPTPTMPPTVDMAVPTPTLTSESGGGVADTTPPPTPPPTYTPQKTTPTTRPDLTTPTPTLTPSPTSTESAPPPPSRVTGLLAYAGYDAKAVTMNLYVVRLSDGQRVYLREEASQPDLHPDGKRILYRSWNSGNRGLWYENFDRTGQSRGSYFSEASRPKWGPEDRIVYGLAPTGLPPDIRLWNDWVVPLGEGSQGTTPNWLPDGHIIFQGCQRSSCGLATSNYNGEGFRLLNDQPGDIAPAASPNGKQIVVTSDRGGGGRWDLYLLDSEGQLVRRLTDDDARDTAPTWSPDGSRIAFLSDRGGSWAIWMISPSGGNPAKLWDVEGGIEGFVSGVEADMQPHWKQESISWVAE